MRMKYISTTVHGYKNGKLVRMNQLHLGFIYNADWSIYQNYNSNSGIVGYWHIVHNRTGYSVGMVKCRKHIKTVLERFDITLFNYAYTTESGFLEWRSSEARYTAKQTWQDLKDSGLLF